jgi:Ca2+-binding RTX toxin-like protein
MTRPKTLVTAAVVSLAFTACDDGFTAVEAATDGHGLDAGAAPLALAEVPAGVVPTCNGLPATIWVGMDPALLPEGASIVEREHEGDDGHMMSTSPTISAEGDGCSCGGEEDHARFVIIGTENDDVIVGSSAPDSIMGLGGDDVICSRQATDVVWAGSGDDFVFAGPGADRVHGGGGEDTLHGGPGRDSLWGGMGDDFLFGGEGPDMLDGGPGENFLDPGPQACGGGHDGGGGGCEGGCGGDAGGCTDGGCSGT